MARHRGTGRAYSARHRLGLPGLIHCLHLPAVQLRLTWRLSGWLPTRHDLAGMSRRTPAVPLTRPGRPVQPVAAVPAAEWSHSGSRLAA